MSMMIQARKELALFFLLAGRGPRAQSFHLEPRLRREELFWSRRTGCTACVDAEVLCRLLEHQVMVVRRRWPTSGRGRCLRIGTRLGCYGDGRVQPWRGEVGEGIHAKKTDPLRTAVATSFARGGTSSLFGAWKGL